MRRDNRIKTNEIIVTITEIQKLIKRFDENTRQSICGYVSAHMGTMTPREISQIAQAIAIRKPSDYQ